MRTVLMAAALLATASVTTIAFAQVKPLNSDGVYDQTVTPQYDPMSQVGAPTAVDPTDARSLASDRDVGEARRAYRNACNQYESPGFCDCVTAGVAQGLMPEEVRIAARTIGERITAQGDAAIASDSDDTMDAQSSAMRIEQVEGHYAAACAQFRG
jgi:hypothetical protein